MEWKDIASTVGRAAPILGTLIGGPAGAAIGGLVASALGTAATPDAVSQALALDPQAAVRLREIESTERVSLQKMALDQAQAELAAETAVIQSEAADRQSARQRDVDIRHAGRNNVRADLMVIGVTVGLIVCVGMLALYSTDIPPGASALITTIASIFGLCLRDAFTFEFGSSRGSQNKDQMIAGRRRVDPQD